MTRLGTMFPLGSRTSNWIGSANVEDVEVGLVPVPGFRAIISVAVSPNANVPVNAGIGQPVSDIWAGFKAAQPIANPILR
jgi:hypothetical protein